MADSMNLKDINKWWHKGISKERSRLTNAPKAHKGDKTSVPTNFGNFAPPLKTFRKPNASKR